MRKYRRITHEDRCQIYALNRRGSSQQQIAEILGLSQGSISRELRRNCGKRGYRFKQAQSKSSSKNNGMAISKNHIQKSRAKRNTNSLNS